MPDPEANPFASNAPDAFDRLIEAVGPGAMFVYIRGRMGKFLLARVSPEDIWQDALLEVWRSRRTYQWTGVQQFRAWLRKIIDHRIHNIADYESADKRGGGISPLRLQPPADITPQSDLRAAVVVMASTTPSRVAIYHEQADSIQRALDGLDADVREVVYLRLIEERTMEDVAQQLGIGVSAAQHRFRKGALEFRRRLNTSLGRRDSEIE